MKFEHTRWESVGTVVTECDIVPLFNARQPITLNMCQDKIHCQRAMDFILRNFRFFKGEGNWFTILDRDSIMKITILENYPEYEKEILDYYGEDVGDDWIDFNLRFEN